MFQTSHELLSHGHSAIYLSSTEIESRVLLLEAYYHNYHNYYHYYDYHYYKV